MRGGDGEKRGRRSGRREAGVEGGVNVSYNDKFCALNINVIVFI